jgi:hypothetical protein
MDNLQTARELAGMAKSVVARNELIHIADWPEHLVRVIRQLGLRVNEVDEVRLGNLYHVNLKKSSAMVAMSGDMKKAISMGLTGMTSSGGAISLSIGQTP